ncbi:hypothetical protein O181_012075 [Austropuccinia psidii MF-1]|uniref:Integrase catalytic domain-containing protein n=1 Tax=Austropuccinia psidii MF-1 TaxID=1389203 RepID=A0A9Q3GMJ8_9BASI|nr:hypothetical protein [Austropuccinia psidii MF-1]
MTEKKQAEGLIMSFLNELKNKLAITPGYIHTDRGGEFDFNLFRQQLLAQGISLEQGPPHSPQTNGVAERFNQTLLTKIRCLLGQSNIPISYWDEATRHASLLLNLLPHRYLQMNSPNDLLLERTSTIQLVYNIKQLVPFVVKVVIKDENPVSKVSSIGHSMKALKFEPYYNALRVLDTNTGKVKISCDYVQLRSVTSVIMRKDHGSLPESPIESQYQPVTVILPTLGKSHTSHPNQVPHHVEPSQNNDLPLSPTSKSVRQSEQYTYIPFYDTAPRNISTDVITYKQAMSNPVEEKARQQAMKLEYDLLMNHNTGDLVPYPPNGTKARWVVLGNHQEHMIHYYNTWASVGRNETFKVMLILVITQVFVPFQFNIETAFLHGEMDAKVYVKQVKGFEVPGEESYVWCLNKSLYGTEQVPRMWQAKLVEILGELGMHSSRSDDSLYLNNKRTLFLHVHVDDGFLIGKLESEILKFLHKLNSKLKLKYQRHPTQHLGYRLDWRTDGSVSLSQRDLIMQLLRDNDMEGSCGVKTPCNTNLLKELEAHTQPNVLFAVNSLSRHSTHPTAKHRVALKNLLRYLKGSCDISLCYSKPIRTDNSTLTGWADADYANNCVERKSILGNLITLCRNPVSWLSKKQSVVAQSTTEAEFISMNVCAKQLQWLTYLMRDLGQDIEKPLICNDNFGAVTISSQHSLNSNTKHIEIQYQYVRDLVVKKLLEVRQVGTDDMLADILTKPLGIHKLQHILRQLHLENQGGVL